MKIAFRFRLYPSHKQERKLLRMLEAGRRLWNDALAHRKRRWEEKQLSTSYSQQCLILTAERQANPLLGELYSQAGQEILRRLDTAFKAFFEHRARYPRFKRFSSRGRYLSPGVQRVGEARHGSEEALPLEGRERQSSAPQGGTDFRAVEDLHGGQGA